MKTKDPASKDVNILFYIGISTMLLDLVGFILNRARFDIAKIFILY